MRSLRIILVPLIPGLFVFAYVWAVDGGGAVLTCVPGLLAGLAAGATSLDVALLRRILIPGYLVLFMVPVVAYSIRPRRSWLAAFGALGVLHLILVCGIILQDD